MAKRIRKQGHGCVCSLNSLPCNEAQSFKSNIYYYWAYTPHGHSANYHKSYKTTHWKPNILWRLRGQCSLIKFLVIREEADLDITYVFIHLFNVQLFLYLSLVFRNSILSDQSSLLYGHSKKEKKFIVNSRSEIPFLCY